MDGDETQFVDDYESSQVTDAGYTQDESDAQHVDGDSDSPSGQDESDAGVADEDEDFTQQTVAESEVDDLLTQDDVPASQVLTDSEDIQMGTYTKTRSDKDILVAQLLCRWWYVLPDWPPANYNYHEQLEKHMLRCYSVKDFEDYENVDSSGYRKCYQISAFPGVYRDFKGVAYDLRPPEGKPCYNNMVQKSEEELVALIKSAINKQISLLRASARDESPLIKALQEELAGLG